jgi:hypothetical protein
MDKTNRDNWKPEKRIPSYMGDWDQEDRKSRPGGAANIWDPTLSNITWACRANLFIPAVQETEIRRSTIQGQSGQKGSWDSISTDEIWMWWLQILRHSPEDLQTGWVTVAPGKRCIQGTHTEIIAMNVSLKQTLFYSL